MATKTELDHKSVLAELAQERRLLSVKEVAARLSASPYTLYDAINEGKLRAVRVSSAVRLEPVDVVEWLSGGQRESGR
jgi:excisionase family DNA binding protein